jgi:hypothetical protein
MPDPRSAPEPSYPSYRPPADLPAADLLVVLHDRHYLPKTFETPLDLREQYGLPIRCRFTRDRDRLPEADAVLFHLPTLGEVPRRRAGQRFVLMSMEAAAHYPALTDPETRGRFDWTMTYELDSDVPAPYLNEGEYGHFEQAPLPLREREAVSTLFIASHPVAERDAYVRELMDHLDVASPGACLTNLRVEGFAHGGADAARALIRRYRFSLAFENSRCRDYVTEKLFRALWAGAVPVYRGAPNVREFLPASDAAILVDDFESPRALADHLAALAADDAAYARHLAWKQRPFAPRFEQILGLGSVESRVRLAIKLAHGCDRGCACGGRLVPAG